MKRFLLVILLLCMLSGCSSPFIDNQPAPLSVSTRTKGLFPYAEPLTIDAATDALKENGLQLNQNNAIDPADFTFDGIMPVVYEINNCGHFLLIYDYKTIAGRNEAGWDCSAFPSNDRYFPDSAPWFNRSFTAKNILLVLRINTENWTANNTKTNEIFKSLSKTRYDLNDGQTFTFADQGKNFDARLKVTSFKYWYKDNKGLNHLEHDSQGKWEVTYLGPDPESIQEMHYWLSVSGGSGSCSGSTQGGHVLDKRNNGYFLSLGSITNSVPEKDTIYTLKIKLDNQKPETLYLRNIQPMLPMYTNESFNETFQEYLE